MLFYNNLCLSSVANATLVIFLLNCFYSIITVSYTHLDVYKRQIKRGLIAKVVVYKLDRISRSILDFANMMELFQQYNVEFVSSTEKFDTSTPMGRAMLNICIAVSYTHLDVYKRQG